MADSMSKSVMKALTWRFVAIFVTIGIAWAITGDNKMAAKIGVLDFAIKIVLYVVHERMWQRGDEE